MTSKVRVVLTGVQAARVFNELRKRIPLKNDSALACALKIDRTILCNARVHGLGPAQAIRVLQFTGWTWAELVAAADHGWPVALRRSSDELGSTEAA